MFNQLLTFCPDKRTSSTPLARPLKRPPSRSFLFLLRTLSCIKNKIIWIREWQLIFWYCKSLEGITQFSCKLTSPLNSKNTLKLLSFLRVGWAAKRVRNTSCMATVFLKVARYSLKQNKMRQNEWQDHLLALTMSL